MTTPTKSSCCRPMTLASPTDGCDTSCWCVSLANRAHDACHDLTRACSTQAKRKPKRFLAPHLDGQLQTSVPGVSHAFTQGQPCKPLADYLEHPDSPEEHFEAHKVPLSIIEKSGFLMDIVTPEQKLCRCFTKSYGRFVEGTGSVLQLAPKVRRFDLLRSDSIRFDSIRSDSIRLLSNLLDLIRL